MMDLEKRYTTRKNNSSANPLSYNSTNCSITTSTANLYTSNAASINDLVEQSPESSKDVDSSKFIRKLYIYIYIYRDIDANMINTFV